MTEGTYDDRGGSGWLGFVAIVLFSVGFFRIMNAIIQSADQLVSTANSTAESINCS